jgi:hypothetical protein
MRCPCIQQPFAFYIKLIQSAYAYSRQGIQQRTSARGVLPVSALLPDASCATSYRGTSQNTLPAMFNGMMHDH